MGKCRDYEYFCPGSVHYTHRLKLVGVNLIKSQGRTSNLFVTLQQLHNFLPTSVFQLRCIKIQKELYKDKCCVLPVCNSRGSIGCGDKFVLETGHLGTTVRNI